MNDGFETIQLLCLQKLYKLVRQINFEFWMREIYNSMFGFMNNYSHKIDNFFLIIIIIEINRNNYKLMNGKLLCIWPFTCLEDKQYIHNKSQVISFVTANFLLNE